MTMLSIHRMLRGGRLWGVAAVLIAACVLGLALLARRQLVTEARHEAARASELAQALQAGARTSAPTCSAEVGYVQSLPPSVSLDKFVQSLQDSAKAFDVNVKSVSGEPHAATARTLATLDVNIALHGSYPGIKATLAEGLARFPTATPMRLRLKRDGLALPPVEEATVQVAFALRPAPSGPLDCELATPDSHAREALK